MTQSRGALSHWRVVELGASLAGAFCTKLMAGFGAEVIKVEPPGGDPMRHAGPFVGNTPDPERSVPFQWYHTGKHSVVLDPDSGTDRDRLEALITTADVVVESLAPGRLASLGLGFDVLRCLQPRIILASVTPFGQDGPYRDHQAEEITLYAMSGLMYSTGHPQRAPLAAGPAIAHLSAGMKAYIASLMAGLRVHGGAGAEWIDVSIQEAAADNIEIVLAEYLHLGRVAKRSNDEHPLVPWRIFPCRDGHAAIMGGPIRRWLTAAELFEAPELVGEKYAHMEARIRHRDDIRRLMSPWLMRNGKRDIFHAGQARGLAWGYLASLQDVLESPQLDAREFLVPVDLPDVGRLRMAGAPFRCERTPWRTLPAPRLGVHAGLSLESPRKTQAATLERGGASSGATKARQPLAGIRVADFTHDWAGPHAVRMLADYGAEVIRVEYPNRLDGMRGAYLDRIDQHPRWWQINRNKASITLDLHRRDHLEAAKALIATCDVVVDNSRPGVMERFGLGYEVIKAVNPRVILLCMSAHGATGPWASYAGYGGAIEALSGVQSLTAYERDGDRMRVRELDVTNGIMGACAVMTALVHRQETGEGQCIDLSETETSTWLAGDHLLERVSNGQETLPIGNRHPRFAPQGCYRCQGEDRWLVLTTRSDDEWRKLCHVMGRPDCAEDPRYACADNRRANHDEIDRLIEAWTLLQDAREAAALLQRFGLAAGLVATTRDLTEDAHLRARRWFVTADGRHPGTYPGFPFRFMTGEGAQLRQVGPDLGQHNRDVLVRTLGLPESIIPALDPAYLGTAFDVK